MLKNDTSPTSAEREGFFINDEGAPSHEVSPKIQDMKETMFPTNREEGELIGGEEMSRLCDRAAKEKTIVNITNNSELRRYNHTCSARLYRVVLKLNANIRILTCSKGPV